MAQKPGQRGANTGSPIEVRVGSTIDGIKGISRRGDPASIGDAYLWECENAVIDGGIVKSRGGQSKYTTDGSALGGPVDGIFDPSLFKTQANPGNAGGVGTGTKIYQGNFGSYYDNERTPAAGSQVFSIDDAAVIIGSRVGGGVFRDKFYVVFSAGQVPSAELHIWEMAPINGVTSSQRKVLTFASPDASLLYLSKDAVEWRNKLYFSLYPDYPAATPATYYLYSWDGGATMTQVMSLALDYDNGGFGAAIAPYGANLLLAFGWGSSSTEQRFRLVDPSGTVTVLTMPLTLPDFFCVREARGSIVNYKGEAYVFGQKRVGATTSGAIYKVSGTTVTEVQAGAAGSVFLRGIVFDGYIYYIYRTATDIYVGRTDGSTYNNTYTLLLAGGSASRPGMFEYKGSLYFGVSGWRKSNGTDVSTITVVDSGTGFGTDACGWVY